MRMLSSIIFKDMLQEYWYEKGLQATWWCWWTYSKYLGGNSC